MQAIVLAGGRGTRLSSEVKQLPKSMAPIGERPFLAILLDYLIEQGIASVVLSLGYRHEAVVDFFGSRYRNLALTYAVEASPLGTGGAMKLALAQTDPGPVLVVNGDTLLRIRYPEFVAAHQIDASPLTLALTNVPDASRYGAVSLCNGTVTAFGDGQGPGLINTGVYAVNAQIFEGHELPQAFSFENDFLRPLLAERRLAPKGIVVDAYFIDIGIPEDYRRAVRELAGAEPRQTGARASK